MLGWKGLLRRERIRFHGLQSVGIACKEWRDIAVNSVTNRIYSDCLLTMPSSSVPIDIVEHLTSSSLLFRWCRLPTFDILGLAATRRGAFAGPFVELSLSLGWRHLDIIVSPVVPKIMRAT